ncbi:TfoX/Sxy family DNA transformation protein [Vibrio vulnificus]|nr:TfoX/Sxy family DNA transformation protein [Vibrio vulnificus]
MNIYSQPELVHVRTLVNFVPNLNVRTLFGCAGVFRGDTFIALVDKSGRFFLNGAANIEKYECRGYPRYAYYKRSHLVTTNYFQLPESLLLDVGAFLAEMQAVYDGLTQQGELNGVANQRLKDLPNINLTLERRLLTVGIETIDQLRQLGACKVYLSLSSRYKCPSKTLYCLEAAIRGIHVAVLADSERRSIDHQLTQLS